MNFSREPIAKLYNNLLVDTKKVVDDAVDKIVSVKKAGGKVAVVTGSGPNIHEGVTTLIAELIHKGIVDGVTTSSAVVAHEMAGTLDRVKRMRGDALGMVDSILPRGNIFEISELSEKQLDTIRKEMILDEEVLDNAAKMPGEVIIKAAGNMAYPMGLRTERLARDVLNLAHNNGVSFEKAVGAGADQRTMLGAAFTKSAPCLVSVPQLIGGGMVGIAVADSITVHNRTRKIADMLAEADVIIESAVALTQEIHDGPFETYTGHGIWAHWDGYPTYCLKGKTLIRIDLDPNLKKAWNYERQSNLVQQAIDQGLPKTKLMDIPFRMEMSGFARLENSIPIVGDIGLIWPILAWRIEEALGIRLDFMSYPQQTKEGQHMRKWIVDNVSPVDRSKLFVK